MGKYILVHENNHMETWCDGEHHVRIQGNRFGKKGARDLLNALAAHITYSECRCRNVVMITREK